MYPIKICCKQNNVRCENVGCFNEKREVSTVRAEGNRLKSAKSGANIGTLERLLVSRIKQNV